MALVTSGQRQIARATAIVMAAFVLSRVLGYVRQAVIGAQFGLSPELDAYFAAFRIPDLLFNVVAGGALSSAFIPTFAAFLARDDRTGAWRMAGAIAAWVALILSVTALLAALFAPTLVDQVLFAGGDIPPAQRALTADLLRIMLIATVIFGLSGVVMATLNALQRFAGPALAPALYNLGIIAGAVLLAPSMGVYGLAWGVVGGAALHLLVQLPAVARLRPAGPLLGGLLDDGVRHVAKLMAPRVLGLAIVQINFLVETFLAAPLGPGSLSALAYAWQAMLLPQAVFAQAAATAAFPTFAEQAARGEFGALRATLSSTLRSVLFMAVPATVGILLLREPFIALLLERGQFTAQDTALVAWALLFYVLGLAAHSALEILTRVFYALHDTRTPVLLGAASIALNIVLSLAFIQVFRAWGWHPIGGLGLANALATWLETLALGEIMRRRLRGLEGRGLALSLARTAAATALMSAALVAWLAVLPPGTGTLHQLLVAGGGALAGGAVYAGGAWALGSEEVRALLMPIYRRVRGTR